MPPKAFTTTNASLRFLLMALVLLYVVLGLLVRLFQRWKRKKQLG